MEQIKCGYCKECPFKKSTKIIDFKGYINPADIAELMITDFYMPCINQIPEDVDITREGLERFVRTKAMHVCRGYLMAIHNSGLVPEDKRLREWVKTALTLGNPDQFRNIDDF